MKLIAEWESRLKSEGLAPMDKTYTRRHRIVSYCQPDRVRYGVHSAKYLFEFFVRCSEYAQAQTPRYPEIWNLYIQGHGYGTIAIKLGMKKPTVQKYVNSMRKDMSAFFAEQENDHPQPTHQMSQAADILEIFVEHQQKKGD